MCQYCLIDRPLCTCAKAGCCRCNGARCTRCCLAYYPQKVHEGTKTKSGEFSCRSCGLKFLAPCNCCDDPCTDRCSDCCTALRHACCKAEPITFRNPPPSPAFVYPRIVEEEIKNITISRNESLEILNKEHKLSPKAKTRNKSTRFASVEIEVNEIRDAKRINEVNTRWACPVVFDRSAGNRGFEINTVPACADSLPTQLEDICAALLKGRAQVTTECGLHVHVDCRDYGYQEIQRFIQIYSVIEPTLFAAVHASRKSNTYCIPCGPHYFDSFVKGVKPDTKELKKAILPVIYGPDALKIEAFSHRPNFHTFRAEHYGRVNGERNDARYSAVNLHSYFLRGTIEFRMHHAAIDFVEVYSWAKLLVALMDAVSILPSSKVRNILRISDDERQGFQEFYETESSTKKLPSTVIDGLIVFRSLLPSRYVEHLLSKIMLIKKIAISDEDILPAQLFHNFRVGRTPALSIEKSGLTEL